MVIGRDAPDFKTINNRVMVDGETVKKPELKIDETTQKVSLEGKQIGYAKKEYYMLHKPAGVISATKDDRDKTVLDLITDKKRNDLFPVGRLDKDTEGLLLITNDGELAHRLLSPKKHVDKVYYAKVQGKVDESDVKAFVDVEMSSTGQMIDDVKLAIECRRPVFLANRMGGNVITGANTTSGAAGADTLGADGARVASGGLISGGHRFGAVMRQRLSRPVSPASSLTWLFATPKAAPRNASR